MWKIKHKDWALLLGNAVFVILCLVCLIDLFNYPYIGLTLENQGKDWTVINIDPYGEGAHSGIREGDIILQLDGLTPELHPSARKWHEVVGVSVLIVQTPEEAARTVHVMRPSPVKTIFSEMILIIVGLCFWLMGLNARIKRPNLQPARALFRLNWLVGLLFVLTPASSRGLWFAKELMFVGLALASPLLVHFMAVLLKREQEKNYRSIMVLLLILPILILLTILLKWSGLVYAVSELRAMSLISALFGFTIACILLFRLWGLPATEPDKNQINLMLVGLLAGLLPFLIFTVVPILAGLEPVLYSRVTALFVAILPFTMSYAVIHQYLPDSRKLLQDGFTYLMTGIITSLILYGFLLGNGWLPSNDIDSYLVLFALTMGTIFLFSCLNFVGRKLAERSDTGKDTTNNEEWSEHKEALHPDDEKAILEELSHRLKLEGALVIIEQGGSIVLLKACGRYDDNQAEQQALEEYHPKNLKTAQTGQLLPRTFPAEFYFPFVTGSFSCGLFLGYRRSRITLNAQELPWLNIIAGQTCQRLKVLGDIKSLRDRVTTGEQRLEELYLRSRPVALIKRWLFKNLEEEKRKLARELHDGPLQNSLYLYQKLQALNDPSAGTVTINSHVLSEIKDRIDDLSYDLRAICGDLRPSALKEHGLRTALEGFIQETMRNELITITMDIKGLSRQDRFEEDIELAVFRLVQEGIRNVLKHSGSGNAYITIARHDKEIRVEIKDDGQGFDPTLIQENMQDELQSDSRFGLIGMKERVEGLGGEFTIISGSGQGTVVRAALPYKKGR